MKKVLIIAGMLALLAGCQTKKAELSPVLTIEGGQVHLRNAIFPRE